MANFTYLDPQHAQSLMAQWSIRQRNYERVLASTTREMAERGLAYAQGVPNINAGLVQGAVVTDWSAAAMENLESQTTALQRLADRDPSQMTWQGRGLRNTLGFVHDVIYGGYNRVVKPAVRTLFTGIDSLAEELVQRPYTAASVAMSRPDINYKEAFYEYGSSEGLIAGRELINAARDPDRTVLGTLYAQDDPDTEQDESFLGRGFFPGGTVAQESYDQRRLRIDGQRANVGTANQVTQLVGQAGTGLSRTPARQVGEYLEPGGQAYNLLAGTTQLAADVFLDPSIVLTGGTSGLGKAVAKAATKPGAAVDLVDAAARAERADDIVRLFDDGIQGKIRARARFSNEEVGEAAEALRAGRTETLAAAAEAAGVALDDIDGDVKLARWLLREAGGLDSSIRPAILRETAEGFVTRPEVLDMLAKADRWTIHQALRRSPANQVDADLIRRLGDAENADEVAEVVLDTIGKGYVSERGFYSGMGTYRTRARTAIRQSTFAGTAPTRTIHIDDGLVAVDTLDEWAKLANVPIDERRVLFSKALDATSQRELFAVAEETLKHTDLAGNNLEDLLQIIKNAPDDLKGTVARKYGLNNYATLTMRDEAGKEIPVLASQVMDRGFRLPDVVAIRRAARRAKHAKVFDREYLGTAEGAVDWMADASRIITRDIFKPPAILRPAYIVRIGLEEQMRMAMSGLPSILTSPSEWYSFNFRAQNLEAEDQWWVTRALNKIDEIAPKGIEDIEGVPMPEVLDGVGVVIADAWRDVDDVGQWAGGSAFDVIDKVADQPAFIRGWQTEQTQIAGDASARWFARNGPDLEGGMRWAKTDSSGQAWVRRMSRNVDKYAGLETDDDLLRKLLNITRRGLHVNTGGLLDEAGELVELGNREMIEHIGKGAIPPRELLERNFDLAPRTVRVPVGRQGRSNHDMWSKLFDEITGKPTSYLARWPAFRGEMVRNYGKSMAALADDGMRAQVVNRAISNMRLSPDETRLLKRAQRDAKGISGGIDNLADYNEMVKIRSAAEVKRLLFDVSTRSNAQVALEPLFPFLDAWKEVTQTWGRLARQNPAGIVRGMQGYQSLVENGTIYANEYGEQVFVYGGAGPITKFFTPVGGPVGEDGRETRLDMVGRVQGMNIITSDLGPGAGPVPQWIVGLMPFMDSQGARQLREWITPYGTDIDDIEDLGSFTAAGKAIAPAWAEKMFDVVSAGGINERQWNATAGDVMSALIVSGRYEQGNREDQRRLIEDSTTGARWVTAMQALIQFAGPTGPTPTWSVDVSQGEQLAEWDGPDPDGRWLTLRTLAQEYRSMIEQFDGDSQMATALFIDQYGIEPFYVAQARSVEIEARPVTEDGDFWIDRHSDAADRHTNVVDLFVPADLANGELDLGVWRSLFEEGYRESLDTRGQKMMADRAKAWQMYYAARQESEGAGRDARTRYLQDVRAVLDEQFPGWYDPAAPGIGGGASDDQKIKDLYDAVEDPELQDSPLVEPLTYYLVARNEALARSEQRGSGLSSQDNADLRVWLERYGSQLAMDSPEFSNAWNTLLKREVVDDR